MGRGMVLPDRAAPGIIDLKRHLGTRLHRSLFDRSDMSENVAGIFFCVGDLKANAIRTHDAGVADLPARFAVERRLIEEDHTTFAFFKGADLLAIAQHRGDDAFGALGFVTEKFRGTEFFAQGEPDRSVCRLTRAGP